MRVMVILIYSGASGTVNKGLEMGLEELEIRLWIETIKIIALLRSNCRPEETYGHSNTYETPLAKAGLKDLLW